MMGYGGAMMGDGGAMMAGAYVWAVLVVIALGVVAAGVLIGGLALARNGRLGSTSSGSPGSEGHQARDILRRRFADGQIDEADFSQRMSALSQR